MEALEALPGRPRVLVIANRASGRCGARWRGRAGATPRRIERLLVEQGLTPELHLSQGPEEAAEAIRRAREEGGFSAVVAAGGDGTLRLAAESLAGSDLPLGLLPMGTENVLARAMGVPFDLEGACRHLVRCPVRAMDLGRVGGRHFLCFTGIGFDAQVVEEVDLQVKEALGSLAYVAAAVGTAWKHRDLVPRARLTVDGRIFEHEFWLILVGNIPLYGGQLRLTPRACPRDALLDVCVFRRTDLPGVLRQWAAAARGVHPRIPEVGYYQGREIVIETDPPIPYQMDGDSGGLTPVRLVAAPGALRARF